MARYNYNWTDEYTGELHPTKLPEGTSDQVDYFALTGITSGTRVSVYVDGTDFDEYFYIKRNGTIYAEDDNSGIDNDAFLTWTYQTGDEIYVGTYTPWDFGSKEADGFYTISVTTSNDQKAGLRPLDNLTYYGTINDDRIVGGFDNDILFGFEGVDRISGGEGNDYINGGYGNDILNGNNGKDILEGGYGNDMLYGGEGADMAYYDTTKALYVNLSKSISKSTELGIDTLYGIDDIQSGSGNDKLYGSAGRNLIRGAEGNDIIVGGGGGDLLNGDSGHDHISGGSGYDRLWGAAGEDVLIGGWGKDRLTGGQGADIFVFGQKDGQDIITDFQDDVDRIEILYGTGLMNDIYVYASGNNTVLEFGQTTVTLLNTNPDDINYNDFIFA